jgi:integrase
MSREATGQLIERKSGWYARITTTIDGERVRVCRALGTRNKSAASRKLARLLASENPTAEEAQRAETIAEASERVHELRLGAGVANAKNEIASLRAYAVPTIGHVIVTAASATDINQALDAAKAAGKSRQTVLHVRQRLSNVFEQLRREGIVPRNPVEDSVMPGFADEVTKERAVLEDHELVTYLAYVHPQEHWQMAILERQVAACVARMFGGLRTGDLHALRWEAFDVGAFSWGWAPRRKTKRPQRLHVPDMLRPILADWWERHGRPAEGLLFPARRGKRAGEEKRKVSHADAFRRDLKRAFGVERWNADEGKYEKARTFTPRERELFEETPYTLPVDFHSWRRAFSQALANADVNAQQASALAGHASLAAHQRYLQNADKARHVPLAALPQLTIGRLTSGSPPVPMGEPSPAADAAPTMGRVVDSGHFRATQGSEPVNDCAPLAAGASVAGFCHAGGRGFESRPPRKLLEGDP